MGASSLSFAPLFSESGLAQDQGYDEFVAVTEHLDRTSEGKPGNCVFFRRFGLSFLDVFFLLSSARNIHLQYIGTGFIAHSTCELQHPRKTTWVVTRTGFCPTTTDFLSRPLYEETGARGIFSLNILSLRSDGLV
ncbi:uncharacterized protein BT62DRAFT_90992 [Guyanagaster necrorhizus]|uniref:Uncharacterized protein n=1 Tax=Guyanagaster necrorhizus TaxID=856835 RepID=A0A9P8AUF5_9AGAR|nr:uncharacterized protein BT62DRAFT_90992 [Guyanagaster necrorhizus MCA 3950]KAG7446857.1 hypothetical protein BT62DRAFT_90992 [Guyanagaster necrorhizus MCA 3950]